MSTIFSGYLQLYVCINLAISRSVSWLEWARSEFSQGFNLWVWPNEVVSTQLSILSSLYLYDIAQTTAWQILWQWQLGEELNWSWHLKRGIPWKTRPSTFDPRCKLEHECEQVDSPNPRLKAIWIAELEREVEVGMTRGQGQVASHQAWRCGRVDHTSFSLSSSTPPSHHCQ
jgi:hypothetical protein